MFDKTIHTHVTTCNSLLVPQVWLFLSPKLLINQKEGILNLSALWPHAFCTAQELDPSEGSEQWVAQRSDSHLLTMSGALKQNRIQLVAACSAACSRLHARRGMPGASSFMVFMDPSQGVQNTGEAAPSSFFVRFFSSQEPEFIPRLRNSEPTFLLPRGIL